MLSIVVTGVGGQGTVLATSLLAYMAEQRGWQWRSAETIGMAQRGGSVVSYLRVGDKGEEVFSPLCAQGEADLVIAFEPAEALRAVSYMNETAQMICVTKAISPVTAALLKEPYDSELPVRALKSALGQRAVLVNNDELLARLGAQKALNVALLTHALASGCLPFSIEDLRDALRVCVKPRFLDMNLEVVDAVLQTVKMR